LTWFPSDQICSKQGVVAPLVLQFVKRAVCTGEAAAMSVVNAVRARTIVTAATAMVAMRARIELIFDSLIR
jgi:hypothetical protein